MYQGMARWQEGKYRNAKVGCVHSRKNTPGTFGILGFAFRLEYHTRQKRSALKFHARDPPMLSLTKPSPEMVRAFLSRQEALSFSYAEVGASRDRPPAG